jgi:PLP dependent protein
VIDLFFVYAYFSIGMSVIQDNVRRIMERVQVAAEKAGRPAGHVQVVAITKTVPIEKIIQALNAGITHIGENRVREAENKRQTLGRAVPWHLVGHLQTNKVKKAVMMFDLIQSVDSERLALAIDQEARLLNKIQPILVQVNTSGEATKSGVAPGQVMDLIARLVGLKNIAIKGLMTIGAWLPDPEQVRPYFKILKKIQEEIINQRFPGIGMEHLSMGMTDDYTVAIEEGATMVRIGRGIFGERET